MELREIPSCPLYLAREDGWLVKKPAVHKMPNGGFKKTGGVPTRGQWDGSRYILAHRQSRKTWRVARLICEAFHGPPPADMVYPVCMHLDEDSRNNRPDNLRWGTQKENLNAPGFVAYCKTRTGDNNPYVKGRRNKAA